MSRRRSRSSSTATQRRDYTVMFISYLHADTAAGRLKPVNRLMGDPRNVAHAKKVTQEKQHKAKAAQKSRPPRPAGKGQIEQTKPTAPEENAAPQEAVKP